jgi:hypothetical protein
MKELTVSEVESVSGRGNISTGLQLIGAGLGLAAAAGLGGIPILVLLGAGTAGELLVAGGALGLAGAGGGFLGWGLVNQD